MTQKEAGVLGTCDLWQEPHLWSPLCCGTWKHIITVQVKTCADHTGAVVHYEGESCPFCTVLTDVLTDLECTKRELERVTRELTAVDDWHKNVEGKQ